MNRRNFLLCGLTGWCLEIIYTAVCCGLRHDHRLIGHTSLWMFPIYGMASFICPVYQKIKRFPAILRGLLYGSCIMFVEYVCGMLLKLHHSCPWDYSDAETNINGVVRLDYLPLWIFTGLIFERILCRCNRSSDPKGKRSQPL